MKSALRFSLVVSVVMFVLAASTKDITSVAVNERVPEVPLVLLESSEGAIQGAASRAIAVSASGAQILYTLELGTEDVLVHESERKLPRRFSSHIPPQNGAALAVGREGNIYCADSMTGQIKVMNPAGQPLTAVSVVHPIAFGILSNNNIVVASSAGPDLLHLHGPTGSRLASFGEMKTFDSENHRQNLFLNQGKIAIGPSDAIYYVSTHAPIPTARKFSAGGRLLSEFEVAGSAIEHQLKTATDFLRRKESYLVGGFTVITSATVDASTGNLWISMNGTSKTGVVYEYDPAGAKLREYGFVLKDAQGKSDVITGIKDIVVRDPWIYVLLWDGRVFRFNLNTSA